MLELVFTRRYSMGHRLFESGSNACATPHGHNEEVIVYLNPDKKERLNGGNNMVLPFYNVKSIWHRFIDKSVDHSFHVSEKDPLLEWFRQNEPHRLRYIMVTPGDPTTELLACLLMSKVNVILKDGNINLFCHKIEIRETPTNTVTFSGDPLEFLPDNRPASECWWQRPDLSISNENL